MVNAYRVGGVVVALLVAGWVHGRWTDRWGPPDAVRDAAGRLPQVAFDLGDWKGQDVDIDTSQLTDIAGVLCRRYVHARTGRALTVYLVCGRPGPVSEHTPDVCYRADGYQIREQARHVLPLDRGDPAELWTAELVKTRAADRNTLRMFWGWNAGGAWSAPANPRLAFARHPVLYKLYVIQDAPGPDEAPGDGPCADLMRRLLPEIGRHLAPAA